MMRGWIPPLPLLCGIFSFGLSWPLLFAAARAGAFDASWIGLAWVHALALGWITTIALAVLLHAVPAFLDVEWGGGARLARACTAVFALAALGIVAGFFFGSIVLLETAGAIVLAALVLYVAAILQPLARALRGERLERAVARAFAGTFAALLATALLGTAFAYAFGGALPGRLLATAPQAHALLGIGGWLSLLVVGVSARTMGPIAGARSRFLALHVGGSSALALGTIAAAAGAAFSWPVALYAGCALLVAGSLAYAADIADVVRRAVVPHRPPQRFMLAAALWAVVAAALTVAAATGAGTGPAAIYAALVGWIGSAVMAHLHHIGVRVLLTGLRGDEDETRPGEVLDGRITWLAFALYEAAALAGTVAVAARAGTGLEVAAMLGFGAFLAVVAGMRVAVTRARRLPIVL